MKKIRAFIYIFYKSIVSPKYYTEVVKTKLKFSLKYFFTLVAIVSWVVFLREFIPLVPKVNAGVDAVLEKVTTLYNDDLVITIKEGKASVNLPEPLVISAFDAFGSDSIEGLPTNLLVFDSEGTIDDLTTTYDTLVLVNSSNMIFRDNDGIRVESLGQIPDGTFTKEDLLGIVNSIHKYTPYIPYVIGLFILMGVTFYFFGIRFMAVFSVAFGLLLVGKMRKLNLLFSQYLRMALHVVTVPVLLDTVSMVTGFLIPLPFWFFVLSVILGVVALSRFSPGKSN